MDQSNFKDVTLETCSSIKKKRKQTRIKLLKLQTLNLSSWCNRCRLLKVGLIALDWSSIIIITNIRYIDRYAKIRKLSLIDQIPKKGDANFSQWSLGTLYKTIVKWQLFKNVLKANPQDLTHQWIPAQKKTTWLRNTSDSFVETCRALLMYRDPQGRCAALLAEEGANGCLG